MSSHVEASSDAAYPSREELALEYLETLPFEPYPFQEEAVLSWFGSRQGVLVCAPTGMGKTLIAEAGLFEALKTGKRAYYTTPLIALTEQKYVELQAAAERWGFDRSDVGLITGNRRENVDAKILVVVAEILFNRLLSSDAFDEFAGRPLEERVAPTAPVASSDSGEKKITAASLNAKKSVAVYVQDEKLPTKPLEGDEPPKPTLPEVPIDESDFEDDADGDLSNAYFSFEDVSVVVMDEFHQFADPERGVVWEFTIGLLPAHVRTLLISATVGNAVEFVNWLRTTANRTLDLVQSTERKVPLVYEWVGDRLLPEQLEEMCVGTDEERLTPALVFCFNRDECWDVAEVAKGKRVTDEERQKIIDEELEQYDMKKGAGPKLRQLLLRGIGVHHAGILPKYRRIVESLFQKKALSFCICTETLAAGVNLPARSVVLPTLMKGPSGDKKLVEPSTAHQIFGRAGRPQFDNRGYVFALAHEDDVKIARFKEKYDQIPDDVKDPKMREAKKKLKKKMPARRNNEQYWSEKQFEQLRDSSPGKLTSRGPLPWRLLAHMIESNSDVKPIRSLVARRLTGAKRLDAMQKSLDKMMLTLWRGGFVRLAPNPVAYGIPATSEAQRALLERDRERRERERKARPFGAGIFDESILSDSAFDDTFDPKLYETEKKKIETPTTPQIEGLPEGFDFFGGADLFNLDDFGAAEPKQDEAASPPAEPSETIASAAPANTESQTSENAEKSDETKKLDVGSLSDEVREALASSYKAQRAYPTKKLKVLTSLRGVNPIYGAFLLEQLGEADMVERVQAFESLLEMPNTVARYLRVPKYEELPPGALATSRLDKELLQFGLASLEELVPRTEEEEREERLLRRHFGGEMEPRVFVIPFAEKLRRLFDYQYPGVALRVAPVWAAGEILFEYKGDFNKFILSRNLQKQEGVVFRHLLRLILLLEEFIPLKPVGADAKIWRAELEEFTEQLIACCREVDPSSVEETLNYSKKPDLLLRK